MFHSSKNHIFTQCLCVIHNQGTLGSLLPRHIFYSFHAVLCAYLKCLCVLLKWPSFDVVLADQVSVVVPLMKIKSSAKVVFYCHFPDLLHAKLTTALRRIYRKPIDMLKEATTASLQRQHFANTFTHLNARGNQPEVLYRAVNVDQFDESTPYNAMWILVLQEFFFINNCSDKKKNIQLAISALAILHSLQDGLEDSDLTGVPRSLQVTTFFLTYNGVYDNCRKENVEYLEELKALDENFGIVPLETVAAHKPIIACNSGGPVESIIDGVTGFLCDPTPKEFVTNLLRFSGRRRRWVDMLDNMLESCFN
ncbi:hypothetical protein ACHQM5_004777 [Ranunculus cassubicifolius]